MVELFKVKAVDVEMTYLCGTPEVAAKHFLNYLRRHRKDKRPTTLKITNAEGQTFTAEVSWYVGNLVASPFEGAYGEWWKLLGVKKE